jgi:single-strand DNA-binding protein
MISATVVGNLGRDAELKTVGNGSVLSFAVASTGKVKGEKVTTWVSCSLWGSRGEALAQYLTKGTKVAVTGELSMRESAKTSKTYLEVRVDQLELLGGGSRDRVERQERPPARIGGGDEEYAKDDESFEDGLPF